MHLVLQRLLALRNHRDRYGQRLVRLFAGLVLFGVSIALMLTADLGVDSWDVFHQGVEERTRVTFGWVVTVVSSLVLLLWIPLRERPGIGTVANALVVGLVADLTRELISVPDGFPARLGLLGLGVVANGAATGLYIGAGLGPGPRDGLMTGLAARTGWSIRKVRTWIELTVLLAGWALGGPVGVGTLVYALSIGTLTQLFLARFDLDRFPGAARERKPAAVCL